MKHISVIVPAGDAVLSSVVGAFKIFNKVNDMIKQETGEDAFKVDLVGIQEETRLYNGAFTIIPTKHINEVEETDLIIITTIVGDFEKEMERNAPFVEWIRNHRIQNNTELASLCTGAFLLAETGLLNGKACATHWIAHDIFRQRYPKVTLLPNNIISEDNGIYSSGGAYSFLNLLLHLVQKYCGREIAILCSKIFEIDLDRNNQNEFIIFKGQKDHADDRIKKAQEYIEKHFSKKINVEELAEKAAISRRNFVRRFKKATSNTPLEYIQRVKIEAAKKSLETSSFNINQVMYSVGYNDDKAFRNIFRKYTGLSPIEYRNKYNREMAMV